MAHYLKEQEGILVGPSAALNVVGAVKAARKLGPGHTVAAVICDTGTKYMTKLYNPEWLEQNNLKPTHNGNGLEFISENTADNFFEK